MMNGFYKLLLVVLCGLSLSACSGTYPWFRSEALPPLQGQVIDEATNKPIEGAIVLIRWETDGGWSNHFCPHVVTATADSAGRFVSPGWEEWSQHVRTIRKPPVVYKPGYEEGKPSETKGMFYLKRSILEPEVRLKYLRRLGRETKCAGRGMSNFNRFVLSRALYNEARQIVAHGHENMTDFERASIEVFRASAARDYISREELSGEEYDRRYKEVYEELGQ